MQTKEIEKPEVEVTRKKPIQSMSRNERLDDFLYRVEDEGLGDDLPRFVEAWTFYMCHEPAISMNPNNEIESANIHGAFMNIYSVLSELVKIPEGERGNSKRSKSKTEQLDVLLKRVEEIELADDLPRYVEAYTFYMCLKPHYNGIPERVSESRGIHWTFIKIQSFLKELVTLAAEKNQL